MNRKITPMKDRRDRRLSDALAKGALLWGPIYSVGATTAAYWLLVALTDETPVYADILLDSLMIFPLWGVVAGFAKWMIMHHKPRDASTRRGRGRKTGHRISTKGFRAKHA